MLMNVKVQALYGVKCGSERRVEYLAVEADFVALLSFDLGRFASSVLNVFLCFAATICFLLFGGRGGGGVV